MGGGIAQGAEMWCQQMGTMHNRRQGMARGSHRVWLISMRPPGPITMWPNVGEGADLGAVPSGRICLLL